MATSKTSLRVFFYCTRITRRPSGQSRTDSRQEQTLFFKIYLNSTWLVDIRKLWPDRGLSVSSVYPCDVVH